jgi:hypothetical protein
MAGSVQLVFGAHGARALAFAPLTGADEQAAPDAASLLRRLALPGAGLVSGSAVEALTLGDRDRALAALYRELYGDAVLADAVCTACSATYEIRFNLAELAESRRCDGSASGDPPAITLLGSRLRLPVISDLAGTPDTFLERLTLEGPIVDADAASAALEAADPALELDLTGTCPECHATQATPFSISRFLEAALRRDWGFLLREVHLIASTYHWSLDEILGLSRRDRQGFARLLIGEREAASSLMRRVA